MSDFRKKARVFLRDAFGRTSRPSSRAQSHSPVPPPTPPSPPPIPSARTYANPPQPPSTLGTTGSVIHELLATARDGADLCLPLKAALVGVVKIWDICEVYCTKPVCALTDHNASANEPGKGRILQS